MSKSAHRLSLPAARFASFRTCSHSVLMIRSVREFVTTSDNAWYPLSRERSDTYFTANLMGASAVDLTSYQRTLDFLQMKREEEQGLGFRVLPTANKLCMLQLLSKGGVHQPDKGVIKNMYRRFANRVALQIDQQESEAIVVTYFDAAALPSTTTRRNLQQIGYAVGRPIEEGSVISYCVRTSETIPEILTLKPLNAEEACRIIDFQAAVAIGNNQQHPHVLQFSVLDEVPNKPAYFISPRMPATISMIQGLGASLDSAVELWNQISSALTYIHSFDFAHMDVKPSNIFITAAPARFVLGDLGSIARVSAPTFSTRSFVPTDFESILGQFRAAFSIDWWMLAITVLDFIGACHGGGGRFGMSCNQVKELLKSPMYEGKFLFIVQMLESCQ